MRVEKEKREVYLQEESHLREYYMRLLAIQVTTGYVLFFQSEAISPTVALEKIFSKGKTAKMRGRQRLKQSY